MLIQYKIAGVESVRRRQISGVLKRCENTFCVSDKGQ